MQFDVRFSVTVSAFHDVAGLADDVVCPNTERTSKRDIRSVFQTMPCKCIGGVRWRKIETMMHLDIVEALEGKNVRHMIRLLTMPAVLGI